MKPHPNVQQGLDEQFVICDCDCDCTTTVASPGLCADCFEGEHVYDGLDPNNLDEEH